MTFIELITSHLNNRQQRVIVNGTTSDFQKVVTGVPQGTVLFINDLLYILPKDGFLPFVDDTAVISTDKTFSIVENKMNNFLDIVYRW